MSSLIPSLPQSSRRASLILVIVAIAALALASCARNEATSPIENSRTAAATRLLGPNAPGTPFAPADPGHGRGREPYPLAIGNSWTYTIHSTTTLVTDAGPQPPQVLETPWEVTITGDTWVGQRHYFTQAEFDPSQVPEPPAIYFERQDRTGLFERDQSPAFARANPASASPFEARLVESVDRMPSSATRRAAFRSAALILARRMESVVHPGLAGTAGKPVGPPPNDIALLRYPLHTGAAWVVRETPRFERSVTGREALEVPAGRFSAWRLALSSELYGPNDRVFMWFGDSGMLRLQYHAEAVATDDSGNIVGTMLVDFDQVLASAQLPPSAGAAADEEPVISPAPPSR